MNENLQPTDSVHDILLKLGAGNPGAITVCVNILKHGKPIDPDNALGAIGPILSLDRLGLRGSKIWMLYKDVANESLPKTLALLRGWQLGLLTKEQLNHAIDHFGEGIELDELLAKVQARLPAFNQAEKEQP